MEAKCLGPLYRLVYDFFSGVDISIPSQEARMRSYIDSGQKAKAFIAKLVLMRICGVYACYNDYYNDVKDLPIEEECLNDLNAEVKRGFFKKDLEFKDGEFKEKK